MSYEWADVGSGIPAISYDLPLQQVHRGAYGGGGSGEVEGVP